MSKKIINMTTNDFRKLLENEDIDRNWLRNNIEQSINAQSDNDQYNKDRKIVGNINLHKKNSLHNNIVITHETEINHDKMSISYKLFLNSIHIGNIKKDSNYNNKILLIFNPSNNVLGSCTGNTIEEINKKIKEKINDILKFISIFD